MQKRGGIARSCATSVYFPTNTHREKRRPEKVNEFLVALKAKNGIFCIYVESFFDRDGKHYLKHTSNRDDAAHFSLERAEAVIEELKDYRVTGQVEWVEPLPDIEGLAN